MSTKILTKSSKLFLVQKQYFATVSLKHFDWKDVLINCCAEETGESLQSALLKATIQNPVNCKFPVKAQYQVAVLKYVINFLESKNAEVISDIYEVFCQRLGETTAEEAYLHFFNENPKVPLISVLETTTFVSNGTTGLCSWPAARVLAEYCSSNPAFFKNKNILELGCGTGLLGLAVVKTCAVKSYSFTDCHPEVLNLVKKNIELNLSNTFKEVKPEIDTKFSTKFDSTTVRVVNLFWEDITHETLDDLSPDIVLAADVIYDVCAIRPLVSAFELFSSRSVCMFLACAVRNTETFASFVSAVTDSCGWLRTVEVKPCDIFFPFCDVPLKVVEVNFRHV